MRDVPCATIAFKRSLSDAVQGGLCKLMGNSAINENFFPIQFPIAARIASVKNQANTPDTTAMDKSEGRKGCGYISGQLLPAYFTTLNWP